MTTRSRRRVAAMLAGGGLMMVLGTISGAGGYSDGLVRCESVFSHLRSRDASLVTYLSDGVCDDFRAWLTGSLLALGAVVVVIGAVTLVRAASRTPAARRRAVAGRLADLVVMHRAGLLTDEEFDAAKEQARLPGPAGP